MSTTATHSRMEIVKKFLELGAEMKLQVQLLYKKKDPNEPVRFGEVQPLGYTTGKNGQEQVLVWDIEKQDYRLFDLDRVQRVQLTDLPWVKEFGPQDIVVSHSLI